MTDINKLEELAKAATPGPWTMNAGFLDSRGLFPMFQLFGECDCGSPLGPVTGTHEQAEADAAYIAAANPESLLQLISQYRRMEEALRKIASCTSYAPGDMPDIARQALQSTEQQG